MEVLPFPKQKGRRSGLGVETEGKLEKMRVEGKELEGEERGETVTWTK